MTNTTDPFAKLVAIASSLSEQHLAMFVGMIAGQHGEGAPILRELQCYLGPLPCSLAGELVRQRYAAITAGDDAEVKRIDDELLDRDLYIDLINTLELVVHGDANVERAARH